MIDITTSAENERENKNLVSVLCSDLREFDGQAHVTPRYSIARCPLTVHFLSPSRACEERLYKDKYSLHRHYKVEKNVCKITVLAEHARIATARLTRVH